MRTKQPLLPAIGLALVVWLVIGCASTPSEPTPIPTPVPQPTTMPTLVPEPTAAPTPSPVTVPTRAATTAQPQPKPTRILFQSKATSWQSSGELAPNTSIRFVASAQKGQVLTVELTTKPDSAAGPSASLQVSGADGQVLTPDLTTRYKGVLTSNQDYSIEVRSLHQQSISYTLLVAIPAFGTTPYVPVTLSVCQTLQEMATQAIKATFTLQASVPFTNSVTAETGKACNLTAMGTGRDFADPVTTKDKLVKGLLGFTEQPGYQADGPTGTATAVTRDLALVLISAGWVPSVQCPADRPISACDLKPEQKLYTIKIQAAMK